MAEGRISYRLGFSDIENHISEGRLVCSVSERVGGEGQNPQLFQLVKGPNERLLIGVIGNGLEEDLFFPCYWDERTMSDCERVLERWGGGGH